ncbi:MAG: zinc ribbon domain-containing protein [Chloroflexota bacterium]|nr:zinc ribbon domain-containing protein [Chloroflexota bacterium]
MTRRNIFIGVTIAFALWAAFAAAPRAFAQDPNRLSSLKISVWPEHDQPTVLVMLDGTLADTTNLPRDVSILVPSGVASLIATWPQGDGTFAPEQHPQPVDAGNGYSRATFSAAKPEYHIEYYADWLRGALDKTMDVAILLSAPADQVILEFQQPLKATNFSVAPPMQATRTDADGFTYYSSQYANIAAGQTITAQVKYTKTDPNPSLASAPSPAAAPATAAPASPWTTIFLLVALVVLGVVAVVGFFVLQQRSREPAPARAAPRNRTRRSAERAVQSNQVAAFCTQCGHGMVADDLFCPRCGTKRRMVG